MRTLLLLLGLFSSTPALAQTIYVVRHAERQDDSNDTALSEAGNERAEALKEELKARGVNQVFVTNYQRTEQTAAPTVRHFKLTRIVLQADQTAKLLAELGKLKPSDVALVVGHSNTVPEIIKSLSGDTVEIEHAEYSNLFVLKRAKQWQLTRQRY